jgi:hypothetical protein
VQVIPDYSVVCRHNPPSLCLLTSSLHYCQHTASPLSTRFLSPVPASLISCLSHTSNIPMLFERANYTSCLLLVPVHSGFMPAQLYGLLCYRVTALCYIAPSSRLLVPSSSQVWCQSFQVDNHHLCPGMLLSTVYDVDPGGKVGAFPARLQLGVTFLSSG